MNEQLKNHIFQFAKPNQLVLDELSSYLEYHEIKRKEYILKEGQCCKYKYFIVKGCFRTFFINNKGHEKILNFGIEDWWLTDYDSFTNYSPAKIYIQAIEKSHVLRITKANLDKVLLNSLEMNRYFRLIMEKVRIADQRRMHYIFNMSGKELYELFCAHFPDFVQRVPLYMLASYLGITPEFLSKIRAKK